MKSSLFKFTAGSILSYSQPVSATATASIPSSRNSRRKKRAKDSNGKSYPARDCNSGHNATARLVSSRTDCSKGQSSNTQTAPAPDGRPVIKIFHIEDGDIDDVLDQLEESPGWNSEETCKFKEVDCDRKGVTRYASYPPADYADRFRSSHGSERG